MLGTALATALATAPPAAARNPDNCLPGQFCLWESVDHGGVMLYSTGSMAYVGDLMNDRASSFRNNTSSWVTFYDSRDYRGGCFDSIPPGAVSPVMPPGADDVVTSFRLTRWANC
ncbi:peptidase inhibitor family I36 protein [Streptomyces sp. NPDC000594]|uniref:peptidase inhibitor family I36 protein n=1 Tax=Streptomyces sp. NPDC000594 TaxID=3154261 RepID=UPI003332AF62